MKKTVVREQGEVISKFKLCFALVNLGLFTTSLTVVDIMSQLCMAGIDI